MVLGSFVLAATALGAPGCMTDDDACIGDVCRGDPDETRTFPGPCSAAPGVGGLPYGFSYDAAGRLSRATTRHSDFLSDRLIEDITSYRYDATGQLDRIEQDHPRTVWSWLPTTIEIAGITGNARYDRALFAFTPGPRASERVQPSAELGLLEDRDGTYTWSRAGTTLTRTSASGAKKTYELDEAGRQIGVDGAVLYTYDGDRLATEVSGDVLLTYEYDRGGNLIEVTGTRIDNGKDAVREVYSYACW